MAAALLAAYPDVFAAGAVVAGLPVGAASSVSEALRRMAEAGPARSPADWAEQVRRPRRPAIRGPWPRLSIWHGDGGSASSIPPMPACSPSSGRRLAWPRSGGAGHSSSFSACGATGGTPPDSRSWNCGACPDWRMTGRRGPRAALPTSGTSPRINRAATQCAQDDADSRRVSAMSERGQHEGRDRRGQRLHRPRHPAIDPGARGFHRAAGGRWSRGDRHRDARTRPAGHPGLQDAQAGRLRRLRADPSPARLRRRRRSPFSRRSTTRTRGAAANAAGVTAFLAKPFKPIDLLRAVAALLGLLDSRRRRSGPRAARLSGSAGRNRRRCSASRPNCPRAAGC